ncbi:c-type cytochrome [Albirhodobacter sp. R86504]|uniref:c-type cytochrome n=1 Tax=Albirhodobacter sp. R86504 TaxID=3093848 RepID=UPI00366DFF64
MFNTMTITKVAGAVLGAFLFFLLTSWAASALFTVGGGHGTHELAEGEVDTSAPGDLLAAAASDSGEPEEEEIIDFALGDAAAGEKVFGKCKACHKLDGSNGTGPHLDGVFNRARGGVDGFNYSSAMAEIGGEWTPEHLNDFLLKPKEAVPGTKMAFAGLPKTQDRVDLIAYLESVTP